MRVLIVAENASTLFGGEAILPWHYFRVLRRRNIDVRMIVHARTRDELLRILPAEADRLYFLPDTRLNIAAWKLGRFLPAKISDITLGFISRISTQRAARRLARRLVTELGIDLVHQPIPVSPREPSLLYGLGAPVIMGPMNGNMSFPPAFAHNGTTRVVEIVVLLGRWCSAFLHRLMPGKLAAACLLVANTRTRLALPKGSTGQVIDLVENGVDLELWKPAIRVPRADDTIRLLFIGRLVDWKAVDLLIEAFARVDRSLSIHLEILGDGPMRGPLEVQAKGLGAVDRVTFSGWRPQAECASRLGQADVLVLPSLYECGGAVVLEAMASGVPVIATDWGGPAEYLDESCGILVPVTSHRALVNGLVAGIELLASDKRKRTDMGQAGRERARKEYDWEVKVDKMLAIYSRFASKS